jgi:hypothetical protein
MRGLQSHRPGTGADSVRSIPRCKHALDHRRPRGHGDGNSDGEASGNKISRCHFVVGVFEISVEFGH